MARSSSRRRHRAPFSKDFSHLRCSHEERKHYLLVESLEPRYVLSASYLNGQPGDMTGATLVHNLYRETLGREPEPAGQAFWVNAYFQALAGGTNATAQETVVAAFFGSPEYRQHLVEGVYQDFLNRAPDASGSEFWNTTLAAGEDEKNFLADIMASNEFYADAGNSVAGFVNALYHDILGRSADSAGMDFWTNLVQSPPPSLVQLAKSIGFRNAVVLEFLSTPESEHKLLNDAYPSIASVGGPGTAAIGAYPLADITGDGWDNLYFEGKLSTAAVDALFADLQAGAIYNQFIAGMLDVAQYYNGPVPT